jgi:hypothetical protein
VASKAVLIRLINELPLRSPGERRGCRHHPAKHAQQRAERHGRGHITLRLPEYWRHEAEWLSLFQAACGPPPAQAA